MDALQKNNTVFSQPSGVKYVSNMTIGGETYKIIPDLSLFTPMYDDLLGKVNQTRTDATNDIEALKARVTTLEGQLNELLQELERLTNL